MESANEALRTLPVTCPQRQAANDRRRGGCPRARGLRDQSRGHGISKGVTQPGLWTARVVVRSTGSTGPPLQSRGMSRRHQSCRGEDGTTAGELPTESMWPIIDRCPTPDRDSPRRKKRKCGSQPADQSLFTDVFRSRPLLYTIHCVTQLHASTRGEVLSRTLCLTWDIRDFGRDRRGSDGWPPC